MVATSSWVGVGGDIGEMLFKGYRFAPCRQVLEIKYTAQWL